MAEREGFEPSIRCRIHTFQACAFDHSATSPWARSLAQRHGSDSAKSKAFRGHGGYCLPRRWGLAASGSVLRQGVISIPPLR